jgi:AraC-like DNA-binding protein
VLLRLGELLFIEVIRRCLATLPVAQTGWLAGLRDPTVGRALMLLHRQPAQAWTLERLAEEVGISRSRLAERFMEFVGQPPMQYLTQWRMQLAARLLTEGSSKVAAAAREVGYDSEAAFSRAFKRLVGLSPAEWREKKAVGRAGPLPG